MILLKFKNGIADKTQKTHILGTVKQNARPSCIFFSFLHFLQREERAQGQGNFYRKISQRHVKFSLKILQDWQKNREYFHRKMFLKFPVFQLKIKHNRFANQVTWFLCWTLDIFRTET